MGKLPSYSLMSLISRTTAPIRSIYLRSTPTAALRHTRAAIFRPTPTPRRTMAEQIFAKDAAPPAGPYSHAIKTPTAIYCSGQIHLDTEGNMVDGTIGEKTALCFKNLKAVLLAAG